MSNVRQTNSSVFNNVYGMLSPQLVISSAFINKGEIMIPVVKEVMYVDALPTQGIFFLAADIGGTNSNFGIFEISQEPILILSVHYKSQLIADFPALVKQVCDYVLTQYNIVIKRACFGAAGIIQHNRIFAKPTNLPFIINLSDIMRATGLKDMFLINDFEAVALGMQLIDPKNIITVHRGNPVLHGNRAFLGAGTGLGKSVLTWIGEHKKYIPIASEGGHADAVVYDQAGLELVYYISQLNNNSNNTNCAVSWEQVLSGFGIQHIYRFLGTKKQYPATQATQEIAEHDFNPDQISRYAKIDEQCKDTFEIFTRFYARCAKNFILEALALGGLYIAGGIAAKNVSLFFDDSFMGELHKCGKHSKALMDVPVHIIADYNVSLYGAVVADQLHRLRIL